MARRVAVAASGGRDSTALLHATCVAARGLELEVLALHVHHGLMPQADDWLRHVERQCARWARAGLPVRFDAARLDSRPARGDSVEAWARRQRYGALARMAHAHEVDLVLLAHHRRDQAETLLLQALRGAGPQGLAGMPRSVERDGLTWARPWRDLPRAAIEAYVRRHRLSHVDDDSNHDPQLARGRLRREVWPALEVAFSETESALAHAAARAHEAAQCLHALADIDLAACAPEHDALRVSAWQALEPARRANVLRHWMRSLLPGGVPDSLIARLLDQLPGAASGHAWPAGAGFLRLHRGQLAWRGGAGPQPVVEGEPCAVDLSLPGRHEVPGWDGAFVIEPARTGGVPAELLRRAEIGGRRAGEQFQCGPATRPRSLKKSFQSAGLGVDDRVGPWVRADGVLVFAPGLGLDARAIALPGDERRTLGWQPRR